MSTMNYLLKRILQIIPVLFIVTILIFAIIRLIPGNPAEVILGDRATDEMVAILEKSMGLDKPIYTQYFIFMGNLLKGDLGNSLHYKIPVIDLISVRLKVTILLTIFSSFISLLISFPLGYISGSKKDSSVDQVIRTSALVAISMPQFWFGLMLMIIFAVRLKLVPVGGWGETGIEQFKALILPSITQALITTALLTRNLRNGVVDVLKMDYVDFARSKGLEERVIKKRHIIKNALIPYTTLFSMRMSHMLGGSIIIENVFAIPGVGALISQSIFSRDYAVVQGTVLIFALMVIIMNIITDIGYAYLDPRVRLE